MAFCMAWLLILMVIHVSVNCIIIGSESGPLGRNLGEFSIKIKNNIMLV